MSEQVLQISIPSIVANPDNRKVGGFDPVKLEQLAASIKDVGIQQPIIVRKSLANGGYELVAGERRLRACLIAGLKEIPAIVRELDDLQVLKIQTIENLQREDVHPLDEADGFARLIEKAGYDVEQIAKELGKSASYVYQRLKLRDLIEPMRDLFVEGTLTAGHAILVARLPEKQQKQVLEEMFRGYRAQDGIDVSVRRLSEYINRDLLMALSKVTWRLDDANLVPEAGSCTLCPKRTGHAPALFADVSNDGKKDYCLDRSCFVAKVKAVVEQRKVELKDEPHILSTEHYGVKGTVSSYELKGCKKDERGAVRVLNVDTGNLSWGKPLYGGAQRQMVAADPKEQEKLRKERARTIFENKVRRAAHRRVWDQVRAAAEAHPDLKKKLLPLPVLKMVVERLGNDWQHRILLEEVGKLPQAPSYSELLLRLVAVLAEQALNPDANGLGEAGMLAKHYKVDTAAIEKQARTELAQKAKGPKLVNISKDGKAAAKKRRKRDPEYVEMLKGQDLEDLEEDAE